MSRLRRIVLVRHGETEGESSTRFHGAGDVALSAEGEAQMRAVAASFGPTRFDRVIASPLQRSWRAAQIAGHTDAVRVEADFREIDFGRWEGLTKQEIEASDPVLYEDWQNKTAGFEFPNGEPRGDFRARVEAGLDRLLDSGAGTALVVVHKGVVRTIAEKLLGAPLEEGTPDLAGQVELYKESDGWKLGRVGSNPAAVDSTPSLQVEAPAA
ncbi:MAG: histidine phosphatase family protein [Deltaproteobacteria bacterium]|nr:histidine phosphatase family protein [Deltaproteobacteria bacterium]MBW2445486.1 histidine phosphatase family protein [Deltaproteobacteria bacterium]